MILTPKRKKKMGGRGEKGGWWRKIQLQLSVNFSQHRHKSNCPLLAFLPQSMPHSAAVNFSSPKFLCRCIINSLSSCGKFKKKTPPYQVFTFLKKPQTFHSKNIFLAYFLLYRKKKKKAHTFLCESTVLHFQSSFWGGGGSLFLWLIIYVRIHQPPRVWHWFISFFNAPCVHIYTCVLRSRSHKKKLHSSFCLAQSVYPLRSVPRDSCVPHPSFLQRTQPPPPPKKKKSLVLHRRFLSPAPTSKKKLGLNSPHSPPFRPAPSPKIWLDFSSQPSAQLDFWFQPPGQPPSPLPPNSLLYPVSFPPPPLQFHNLTLNGVRGAGAGVGAEVVEENFKAPSAVKKKPIPSPSYFVVFFFLKAQGGLRFLCPRPHPRHPVQILQV